MEPISWISDLVYTFAKVFPRLEHVQPTHGAVKFTRSKAIPLGPGMHWWWPVWSDIQQYPIKRQSLELHTQTLVSKDDQQVIVSAAVVFEVSNIYKALVDTYDLEDTIGEIAKGAVKEVITATKFKELHNNSADIDVTLTDLITESLEEYGIHVIKAFLTDFSTTIVLRCVQE